MQKLTADATADGIWSHGLTRSCHLDRSGFDGAWTAAWPSAPRITESQSAHRSHASYLRTSLSLTIRTSRPVLSAKRLDVSLMRHCWLIRVWHLQQDLLHRSWSSETTSRGNPQFRHLGHRRKICELLVTSSYCRLQISQKMA